MYDLADLWNVEYLNQHVIFIGFYLTDFLKKNELCERW